MFLLARLVRALVLAFLLLLLGFAAAVFVVRYVVLPDIQSYRSDVADALSQAAGQPIRFDSIDANWDGPRPRLILGHVHVFDSSGNEVLELASMASTLSWQSLVRFQPLFHQLVIEGPQLTVVRDAAGILHLAGIAIDPAQEESGFADWLLEQDEVVVRGARVVWLDQKRAAPPLELEGLDLSLRSQVLRNVFELKVVPPAAVGALVQLQVRVSGFRRAAELLNGTGDLNVHSAAVDLSALRTWIDLPAALQGGRAGGSVALAFSRGAITEVAADLKLGDLRLALGPERPPLAVARASGAVAWKRLERAQTLAARQLSLETADGTRLAPIDLQLRLPDADAGADRRGQLAASALDLQVAAELAAQLPLPELRREQLAALAPRGEVRDVSVDWQGDWAQPSKLHAKLAFSGVGARGSGARPGISGASGSIDATLAGGTLRLDSRDMVIDAPLALREPVRFTSLTAQAEWKVKAGEVEAQLSNIAFANEQLAGTAFGSYRTLPKGPGFLDLTAAIPRAEVNGLSRYVPFTVNATTREWLDRAFVAGTAADAKIRLKGDLERFPFRRDSDGQFEATLRVADGVLDYGADWPRVEGMAADLLFRGVRLEVQAREATILGARLAKVKAVIPDLDDTGHQRLALEGEASGPTAEFLRFVGDSPVAAMIDRFTDDVSATGSGRLTLKFELPLHDTSAIKVNGRYEFVDNTVTAGGAIPPLEQVNGGLSFTESGVAAQAIRAQSLGGAVSIQAASQAGGVVRVTAQGRATAAGLQQLPVGEWVRNLRGATDWRGTIDLRPHEADFSLESDLVGMLVDLPAPLGKPATQPIALRLERSRLAPQRAAWNARYGDAASMRLVARQEGSALVLERGTIAFGKEVPPPERDGIWVSGALKELSYDRWRDVLGEGGVSVPFPVAGVDVSIGRLELLDRDLNDTRLQLTRNVQGWKGQIRSRELSGRFDWLEAGHGKLVARLDKWILTEAGEPIKTSATSKPWDLPALEVTVEDFQSRTVPLGRLELQADYVGGDWRIKHATLSNPDATVEASGAWRSWLARPETALDLNVQIIDAGRLLARFGHADAVQGGAGRITGRLNWAGSPAALELGSLGGDLTLHLEKGQFRKVDQGLGKLLGVISLQSLARRFALDFRDVFSAGFAFDSIDGSVSMRRGLMHTDDFAMVGPSARVQMSGDVDVSRQTQSLVVRVQPTLAEGVSVAGAALGGPAVGIAALVLQKLLKDPIEQLVSFEYQVEGTWAEPKVSKKESAARSSQP